ncbi:MAG: methionine adenosyltransferase [Verrucomicrobia bacterium]|nr:methionine adenosyltransferase [Verrucomicrobiota bacterium]MBU4289643.1 methionine adenosyltransferase [Verrucomicrobiota bacterium]MBU4430103.1 methionine adenosyltransferase [Verrucomicrobiota bacterium]MCG2681341.1 methionine adenosyltransferase [Kiritimatiellia bacterium]
MSKRSYSFTSESITEGHPDKIADAISDAVLDACLAQDKTSRVACETMVATGMAVLAGEITTKATVNYADVVRDTIKRIGYVDVAMGFDAHSCAVLVSLDRQSPDISQGVTAGQGLFKEQGAGDQGMMFGYACDETRELMPMPIMFAHRLTRALAKARRNQLLPFLRPDGKSQVTVIYEDDRPVRVDTVVVSAQHSPEVPYRQLKAAIIDEIIRKEIPHEFLTSKTRYLINPTGRFVVGGPQGDTGLTGRKIIADTYGGMGRHGGGAFSGKDPSKVDRSAAYIARYIAKNIVAAKLARRCEVQLAYAIGYPEPVSVLVQTFGTGTVSEERIERAIRRVFGLKPAQIIKHLDLLRPIYSATAAYGHFGRIHDLNVFTWEKTDKVNELKKAL